MKNARRRVRIYPSVCEDLKGGISMNTFYEHHKNSIRFQYRCFDRILLNGLIQPVQQEQRVVGFFDTIGQPNKITVIFGRKIQKHHAGKLLLRATASAVFI